MYPADIYDPRLKENVPAHPFVEAESTTGFAEDLISLDENVVAVEETLGVNPQGAFDTVDERIASKFGPGNFTFCTTYRIQNLQSYNSVLVPRIYQNETVSSFLLQPEAPRNVSVSTTPILPKMTGTITVNGKDIDGASISEEFVIDDSVGTNHIGVKAFAFILSVVVVKTGGGVGSRYSVGLGKIFGFLGYPWNAATDVLKLAVNGVDRNATVNPVYGTIDYTPVIAIVSGDIMTAWYRPHKT